MGYTPIFNALDKKPISQYFRNGELGSLHIVSTYSGRSRQRLPNANVYPQAFRDQLSIPTWLMLGALIQGVLCFLPYRNLLLVGPAAAIILYKIVVVVLQTIGVLRNPLMDGAIPNRTAILYADEHGKYETPAGTEVCTIQLAAVCNHPLGMFAPGFKEVGDRFTAMTKELEADATKYGYLGSTTWINQSDRVTGNEQMIIVYFKSLHHLHEYAHGERHTDTMLWWSRNADKMKHIGIMHEVSAAPKNGWEGIYINYRKFKEHSAFLRDAGHNMRH